MSVFREAELRYLAGGRQLGRLATVGADGTPHVVPVAWIYNAVRDTIDDLGATEEWHPRGIEVRGRGEAIALPTPLIRIHPERIVSWGLEGSRRARDVAP